MLLKPGLLQKRKRGGRLRKKIQPPSSAPVTRVQRRCRYYLRSMASGNNTGCESSAIDPNSGPSQYNSPQSVAHPSRAKRAWSEEEDALLIEVLLELNATGKYKADRGFKPGIYSAAEKELERRRPGGGIRADPHIYSCVKTLKSHFNIVSDMIYNNTSGFGWDPIRMCITADDTVWSAYIQTHKSAAQFRGKTFKYLNELNVLFGADRAGGAGATSHRGAAMNETASAYDGNPEQGSENVGSQSFADIGSPTVATGSTTMSGGRKRKAGPDAKIIANTIERTSEKMESSMVIVANKICDAINNVNLVSKREQLLEALRGMPSLTPEQLIIAHQRFSDRPTDIELFFGLRPEEREFFVHRLIRDL